MSLISGILGIAYNTHINESPPKINVIMVQLHQTCTGVYFGTRQLPIKEQRGRKYVNFQGRQINLKSIPFVKSKDVLFDYIFEYGFRNNPSPILDACFQLRASSQKELKFNKIKNTLGLEMDFNKFKSEAHRIQQNYINNIFKN